MMEMEKINFYSYILWIFLTLPLVITQKYMVVATGKLTNLNSIKDITNFPATKYYTVKEYYVHKSVSGWSAAFNVSGRYSRHFNMNIYVAFPIFQSARDTSANKNFGWLGIKFHKKISNRLEPEKKDEKYREFLIESKRKCEIKNVADFAYLETVNNVYDMNGYMKAVRGNAQYTPNETILLGVNAPFAARNGNKILWIIITALIGSLTWSAIVFISNKNMDATKKNMSVDF